MVVVSASACPHGLAPGKCEICRVLEPTPVLHASPRKPGRRAAGLGSLPGGLAMVAVVAVVAFVVVGSVAAAFFAVLRILELVAVAALAGWLGWRLGVRHGRKDDPRLPGA